MKPNVDKKIKHFLGILPKTAHCTMKRKANLAYIGKFDAWSKKYGVKVVGA